MATADAPQDIDAVHAINAAHQRILAHMSAPNTILADIIGEICDGPYALECAYALADGATTAIWFACACARAMWPLIRWLMFVYGKANAQYAELTFSSACARGHESVAMWLISTFWPGTKEVAYVSTIASDNGLFRLVRHILRCYELHSREAGPSILLKSQIFAGACRSKCIWFIRWLDKTYGLTTADVCECHMHVFAITCAHGHWSLARWLAIRFNLTRTHIRAADCMPLQWACEWGQLHMVRWLVESFRLTVRDVRGGNSMMLAGACNNGHLDVAQWLTERFHLTTLDIRREHNSVLITAYRRGYIDVAQWLVERFGLGREGLPIDPADLLRLCMTRNVGVMKQLIATFRLRRCTKDKLCEAVIESAAHEHRAELVRYMMNRYDIIPSDMMQALKDYENNKYVPAQNIVRAQQWFAAVTAEW